jgi:hypothetical protein
MPPTAVRAERNFANCVKLIWSVQPRLQKHFRSLIPKSVLNAAHPVPLEGRIAIVTNAGRDAVDAAASARKL